MPSDGGAELATGWRVGAAARGAPGGVACCSGGAGDIATGAEAGTVMRLSYAEGNDSR